MPKPINRKPILFLVHEAALVYKIPAPSVNRRLRKERSKGKNLMGSVHSGNRWLLSKDYLDHHYGKKS